MVLLMWDRSTVRAFSLLGNHGFVPHPSKDKLDPSKVTFTLIPEEPNKNITAVP